MNKRITQIIMFLSLIILTFILAACDNHQTLEITNPTITVSTQIAQLGTLKINSTFIGTIAAEEAVYVIPKVSDTVESVMVSVGDNVNAGDLLCRFDDTIPKQNVASAKAGYNSALEGYNRAQAGYDTAIANYNPDGDDNTLSSLENKFLLAEENYHNMLTLYETGAVPKAQVDNAYDALLSTEAALKTAKAGINEALAGMDSAKVAIHTAEIGVGQAEYQLSLYNVTTPISGVVESVNVTANNMFAAGNVAFVISNPEAKSITFYVSSKVKNNLRVGQPVTVNSEDKTYLGAISQIGIVVDPATSLFKVKAILDNIEELPNGTTVEISTITKEANNAVLVPYDTLYYEDNQCYVYVAKDGIAVKTYVTVDLYSADMAAISEGLSAGSEIITGWTSTLKDGEQIRISEKTGE